MIKAVLHRPNGAPIGLSDPVLIGWSADCAVRLPQDGISAWRHALIRPSNDGHQIVALARRKPLYVNEERVPTRQLLAHNDKIRCGSTIFTFERLPATAQADSYLTRTDDGTQYPLIEMVTLIGRNPECHIKMMADETVSRRHAQIERINDVYTLVDTDSRNATYINGTEVVQMQRLNRGDTIRIGQAEFTFSQTAPQLPMVVTDSSEAQRYGRISYNDRMHLQTPYPLEVSLLLDKADGGHGDGRNVRWTTMLVRPTEKTPQIEVRATSPCCYILPERRTIRITSRTDAHCNFEVKPYKVVPDALSEIKIQLLYKGECVKTVDLPIEVYDHLKVGPFTLPNKTHGWFLFASTMIGLLTAGLEMLGADKRRWQDLLFVSIIVIFMLVIACLIVNYRLTRKPRTVAQGV